MATYSSTLALEDPMDRGAWKAAVHGVAEGRARLSDFTFTFHFHALEKEMAHHSSVPAWRIPGTGEPVGLPSMGLHRVGHNWSDLAAWFYKIIAKTGLVLVRTPLSPSTSQGSGDRSRDPTRNIERGDGGVWTLSDGAEGWDSRQACCICAGHKRNSPF